MLPDLGHALLQIDGMRMDLVKPRYETFDELYEYCYKVAGTVGLMTTPVMGVDPSYKVCWVPDSALALTRTTHSSSSERERSTCGLVLQIQCHRCWSWEMHGTGKTQGHGGQE